MSRPNVSLSRRNFLTQTAVAAGAVAIQSGSATAQTDPAVKPFTLRFAPHPNMFKAVAGNDVIDQIKFAHDQGFTAWEHNSLAGESPEMQEKVGSALAKLDMKMGVFVAYASFDEPTFTAGSKEQQDEVLTKIKDAVDVAKRCRAKWFTVVPGSVDQQSINTEKWNKYGGPRLAPGFQTANVIELLRRCSEILEPHEFVMVLEPLNWYANHGGVFLQQSDQAYAICKAVNSPSCKILFDIYHQQITEGNLIPNIHRCWDEIGYFQAGDNPGRKEPGTGEIHYSNVFREIHERSKADGLDFIIGMEHGNSKPGEEGVRAVIQAYRDVDVKE
jgi:hydroxypyruvate isomerase